MSVITTRNLKEALSRRNGPKFIYAAGVPCTYVVCTERTFWTRFMNSVCPSQRNFYEIIEEDMPCHLYIDLDVNLVKFPSMDVYLVKDMVRKYVDHGLKSMGLEITDVIIADSSNDVKGSLHIIYKLKDYIWKNNANVGAFMRRCLERQVKQCPEDYELWVQFVDMCVYSRNRLFRMLGCTKSGQNRVKTIAGKECNFETWKSCKIQPMHTDNLEKIECLEPDGSEAKYKSRAMVISGNEPSYLSPLKDYISNNICSIRGVSYSPEFGTWSINLNKRDCVFKKDRHGKNTNYLIVNPKYGTYQFRCWSQKYECCKEGKTEPKMLPPDILDHIREYKIQTFCPSFHNK